ncbi:MAG: leucine-rich repeat protein [Butyrivibrio sp.]|nr:leucine-rich repeat protein [Muribaculum sp.]MCM1551975.1 leucine-rich repeat protein [Butyrivibrio sp.]
MAKELKKKSRRLKRTVRKTLGTICLITAILVASIPTEGLKQVAADAGSTTSAPATKVDGAKIESLASGSSKIPDLTKVKLEVYNSGNGFQFAFIPTGGAGTNAYQAVIVGFDYAAAEGTDTLQGDTMVIPSSFDAYQNYSLNTGSSKEYAAVSRDGNFLFYESKPAVEEVVSGSDVITPAVPAEYTPCWHSTVSVWGAKADDDLYYYDTDDGRPGSNPPIQVRDAGTIKDSKMRIREVPVHYIGNHTVTETTDAVTKKPVYNAVKTTASNTIFGNIGNVNTLTMPDSLYGVGDFAFYEAGSVKKIVLKSNLAYIGNYSFAGCRAMTAIDLPENTRLDVIGEHAFENCQSLESFTVPTNVKAIGDAAFKGCSGATSGLRKFDFLASKTPSLTLLGCDMFVGCNKLTSVTFPASLTEDVDISNFEGCESLEFIAMFSASTKITEGLKSSFGYDDFKKQNSTSSVEDVRDKFYFEGPTQEDKPSEFHQMAMAKEFAFSYLNSDMKKRGIYELTTKVDGLLATYRVSGVEHNQGPNKLIGHKLATGIKKIDLPKYIGPQTISALSSGVFQDYCDVEQVIIPSTVKTIETNAFTGCHHLKYVLFEEPTGMQIADGAFKTQQIDASNKNHKTGCANEISGNKDPELTFVCPVSNASSPFVYAMNKANNINVGNQNPSYITVFSGWPDGLMVKYNFETESNELIDYLKWSDLSAPADSNMVKIYEALDGERADDYRTAMTNASSAKGGGEQYDREIWDRYTNIVLPDGIQSIKDGLFKENEAVESTVADAGLPNGKYKTLTALGLTEIPGHDASSSTGGTASGNAPSGSDTDIDEKLGGCFAGCTTFGSIVLTGATTTVGDYAFNGCKNLTEVVLPSTVSKLGQIPFTGCENLSHVSFQSNEFYTCDESIIYKLDTSGKKVELVEYLEGRPNPSVNVAELTGVKSIAPEAFANTGVTSVDLKESYVTLIPKHAFQNCEALKSVYLPDMIYTLEEEAFQNCPAMTAIELPATNMLIAPAAFDTSGTERPDGLVFYCSEGSEPYKYAVANNFKTAIILPKFKVTFEDWDGKVLKEQYVEQGRAATPPEDDPVRAGHRFTGWNKDYSAITDNITITAMYKEIGEHDNDVLVTFYLEDFTTVYVTRMVTPGNKVDLPPDPKKDGYLFIGWEGSNSLGAVKVDDLITEKTNFKAVFEELDGKIPVRFIDSYDNSVVNAYTLNPGDAPIVPGLPTREGITYTKWFPDIPEKITTAQDFIALYVNGGGTGTGNGNNGTASGNNPNNPNGGNGSGSGDEDPTVTSKLYTLTVIRGSGSGSYVAGSQPIVIANNPDKGYEFSHWTIDPSGTKIASTVLSATVITMPEGNVTVTANYKAKTGSTSGSGSVSGNNSNRPTNGSNILSTGTTVVIDKNGLSNTGVVSATVKGSSDNFTIKVTESSTASEAVVRALKAEYGDISNIKYFPMDISLYDSTGTRKITDTTGLSITITLPLPDSLATYAGNNQVAGVVNDRLDKLSPKFTTIDKVACVTFTAEHFSPYVIYVETDNLSKGQVVDSTPKTGDGIHPKWFLSIGLACVAMVLFMKKDKRALQKARVA